MSSRDDARFGGAAGGVYSCRAVLPWWWRATPMQCCLNISGLTDARVQVHVVSTIVVHGGTAFGSFEEVAGFDGDSA
jgi:hypothetical protein